MKNIIYSAIRTIFKPITNLCCSLYSLISSALEIVFGIPSKMFAVISDRFSSRADELDNTLDKRANEMRQNKINKETHNAIQSLFFSDGIIGNATVARRLKWFTVIVLQMVSLTTTFKGFYQLLSSVHWSLALALALVVQIVVIYASGTVASNYTPKCRKYLLAIALTVSIIFSYIGIAESFIPFQNYAREEYVSYLDAYEGLQFDFNGITDNGENPKEKVKGLYTRLDNLISNSEKRYGEQALSEAKMNLEEYKSKTKSVVVKRPNSIYVQPDGSAATYGGGNEVVEVSDENANELIEAEKNRISTINSIMDDTEFITNMLANECELQHVLSIIDECMKNPDELSDDFANVSESIKILCEKANEVSNEMGFSDNYSLDLQEIFYDFKKSSTVNEIYEMKQFSEIYSTWKLTEVVEDSNNEDNFELMFLSPNSTIELKQLLDNEVFTAHHSLTKAKNIVKTDGIKIDNIYSEYQIRHPMIYAFSLLNPVGGEFFPALVCLVLALFNDLFALFIGLWIEHRKINWYKTSKLSVATIAPHIYSQFKVVMMPIIAKEAGHNADSQTFYEAFVKVMSNFMEKFKLNAILCSKGFSGYYLGVFDDTGFKEFCSFLITCDLAIAINHDECVQYGLISSIDDLSDNDQAILLTSKGSFWLEDILGSASDDRFGYNETGDPTFTYT